MKRSLFRILASMVLALGFVAPTWAQNPDYPYTSTDVEKVNSRTIFFAHNSVGGNIIDGLKNVPSSDPRGKVNVTSISGSQRPGNTKGITDYQPLGDNYQPLGKIPAFENLMGTAGFNPDIAFFKFCYVDYDGLNAGGNLNQVDALWNAYTVALSNLEQSHPSVRFVHVTMPLYVSQNNRLRDEFNRRLRNEYASELLFDLAALEAVDPNGNAVTSNGYPALASGWASDPWGHLNADGGRHMAAALIGFLANVPLKTGTPPTNVTFTAAQTGGTSGTADSTGIVLAFNQAVTGLTASNITITNGTGVVTKGTLSGSGTTWTIGLSAVATQGNVTVGVANFGNFNVTTTQQTVAVYKNTAVPVFNLNPTSVSLTNATAQSVEAIGGAMGTITVGALSPVNANISVTPTTSGVDVAFTGTMPHAGAPAAITSTHTITVTRQGVNRTLTINVNIPAYTPPTFNLNPTSVSLTNATVQPVATTGDATGAITVGALSPANANISVIPTTSGVSVAFTGTMPHAGAPAAITSTHTITVTRQGVNRTLTINVNIPAYTPPTFNLNPTSVSLTNTTAQSVATTGGATGAITVGALSPANANISVTPTASGVNVAFTGTMPHAGAPAAITSTHTTTVTRQGVDRTLTINVNIPAYTSSAYNLAVGAGAGGTVAGTSSGNYAAGEAISVTATANEGYIFTEWTVTGVSITGGNSANPATFSMPAGTVALTANFEHDSPIPPTPPTITSTNGTTVISGTGSTFQVTATGTAPITYSLSGQPAGVSINSSTGLITIAGTIAVKSHDFSIIAANGTKPDYVQGFTIAVASSPPTNPPTITSASGAMVVSGTGGTFKVTATGDEPITYGLSGQPAGVTINSTTGVITIAATTAAGSHPFTITATNGTEATMSFTLTVTPATSADDHIQKAYIAFFNRPADVPGLTYWKSYPGDMQDLLTEFSQSEEYLSDFQGLNNAEIISKVYLNLFGRLPEAEGLNYWSAQMNAGWVTIANVAHAILGGARNEDMDIVINKARATNMFTNALDTPEKAEAYNNAGPMGLGHLAKEWLATVNENNESLEEALAKLDALINGLAAEWSDSL